METKQIYQRMASIMKATKAIAKGQKNEQQGFMFRGIDDIMNELHSIFADNEVFIIPEVVNYEVQEKISEKTYQGQTKKSITYYTRATIRHHFATTDGSEIVTTTIGEAMDNGDKGMNKAMSIALKYALLQLLLMRHRQVQGTRVRTPQDALQCEYNGQQPRVSAPSQGSLHYRFHALECEQRPPHGVSQERQHTPCDRQAVQVFSSS